jgi:hypothetical protein
VKPIPLILLVVGGVMIYAGINKDNPLTVLKGILTNTYKPKVTGVTSGGATITTGTIPGAYVPNGPAQGQPSTAYVPGGFKN